MRAIELLITVCRISAKISILYLTASLVLHEVSKVIGANPQGENSLGGTGDVNGVIIVFVSYCLWYVIFDLFSLEYKIENNKGRSFTNFGKEKKMSQLRVISFDTGISSNGQLQDLCDVLQGGCVPGLRNWKRSVLRLGRATERKKPTAVLNLTANIEYYKEHGRLPDNVDLQRIKGMGMYQKQSRAW